MIELTDTFFERNGFKRDGDYWYKGQFDLRYLFKYADFRNDWGFYIEYMDPGDSYFLGKKLFVSCGITSGEQINTLMGIIALSEIEH